MATLCKELPWPQVVGEMRERFGLELKRSHVMNFKGSHGIKRGVNPGCFKKGNVPPNKGKPWSEWMPEESGKRSSSSWFKKNGLTGAAAERLKDVGAESVHGDGFAWVKVDNRHATSDADRMRRWKRRSQLVWEAEHGPLPEGWIITHADHDSLNDAPENLVAAPRKLMCTVNNLFHYTDAETLQTALLMAEVIQAATAAEKDPKEGNR